MDDPMLHDPRLAGYPLPERIPPMPYEFPEWVKDDKNFQRGRDLCDGCDNPEYVRGVAELLIDTHYYINMDDKEALMDWLVNGDV